MNIELLNVRIYIQKNEVISDAIGNRKITTLAMPPLVLKLGKSPPMPVL